MSRVGTSMKRSLAVIVILLFSACAPIKREFHADYLQSKWATERASEKRAAQTEPLKLQLEALPTNPLPAACTKFGQSERFIDSKARSASGGRIFLLVLAPYILPIALAHGDLSVICYYSDEPTEKILGTALTHDLALQGHKIVKTGGDATLRYQLEPAEKDKVFFNLTVLDHNGTEVFNNRYSLGDVDGSSNGLMTYSLHRSISTLLATLERDPLLAQTLKAIANERFPPNRFDTRSRNVGILPIPSGSPTGVAVYPFAAKGGTDAALAEGLSSLFTTKVAQGTCIRIVAEDVIRDLARQQGLEQSCGTEACQIDLAQQAKADVLVRGDVARIGSSYVLTAIAVDLRSKQTVFSNSVRSTANEDELIEKADNLAQLFAEQVSCR